MNVGRRFVLRGIRAFALISFFAISSATLEVPSRAAESRLAARAQPLGAKARQPAAESPVLLVPRGDRIPLMLFVSNTGITSHPGGSSVLHFYSMAPLGSSGKSS